MYEPILRRFIDSSTTKGNKVKTAATNIKRANLSFNPVRINQNTVNAKNTESATMYDHFLYNDSLYFSIKVEELKSPIEPSEDTLKPYQTFSNKLPPRALRINAPSAGNKIGKEINNATASDKQKRVMKSFLSSFSTQINAYAINAGKTINSEKHAMEKQV